MFLDRVHLKIQAGSGGGGCESYMHRTDRKAVPDGGDGGRGGSVIFRADPNAPALHNFRFRQSIIAEGGGHGSSNRKRGRDGKDTLVLVPVGTRLFDKERGLLIRELLQEGDQVTVVQGGAGGVGNAGSKDATLGEPGPAMELELVFRIPADVFFIGLPNSGKSSLLNRLTRSHAKSEAYPFSTQNPEVGVCFLSDYEKVTLCDLPSVYAASHEGRGRGNDFLAHLENARLLFFVIEPYSQFAASPEDAFHTLRRQLELYNPQLLQIPYAVLINKADLVEGQNESDYRFIPAGIPSFRVSALNGEGLDPVLKFLRERFVEGKS